MKSIEVCEGFPPEVILRKTDDLDWDAIVLGTHRKGIIPNTFLKSTSKRVLRRTRKPVFIIPLPKGELDITFHGFPPLVTSFLTPNPDKPERIATKAPRHKQ